MKFEYNYTKKDFKNYLSSKNTLWIKLIYILYFALTLSLCFKELTNHFFLVSLIILTGFILLYGCIKLLVSLFIKAVMSIFEKINPYLYGTYKCKIDKNKIVTVNDKYKVTIKKDDIKNIKINDRVIEISSKKDTSIIVIEKIIIGDELYSEVIEAVSKLK